MGIDQIIIDDAAKKTFPKGFDYQLYKFALAQRFESALSKNDIALIPYSAGGINDREIGLISKFKDAPNINHEKLKLPVLMHFFFVRESQFGIYSIPNTPEVLLKKALIGG